MFSIENTLILAAVCGKSNYLMEIFHISDCFALNANGDRGGPTLIELQKSRQSQQAAFICASAIRLNWKQTAGYDSLMTINNSTKCKHK